MSHLYLFTLVQLVRPDLLSITTITLLRILIQLPNQYFELVDLAGCRLHLIRVLHLLFLQLLYLKVGLAELVCQLLILHLEMLVLFIVLLRLLIFYFSLYFII